MKNKTGQRILKFRAWYDKSQTWVYFDLPTAFHDKLLKKDSLYISKICQYTGLKDKNGTPIYEGDILALGDLSSGTPEPLRRVEVKITNYGGRGFAVDYSYPYEHNYHAPFWVEVVGNIHENPELLENVED